MRLFAFALLLTACVDPVDLDSSSQDLRPRCSASNPDCEAPPDPPPPPDHPGHPQPPPDNSACNALVTGSVSISASGTVPMGSTHTISWDVTLPTTCTASGQLMLGEIPVLTSGSLAITALASRSYSLAFEGRQLGSVNITTQLPSVVRITGNTYDQQALFKQAVELPNEVVLINPTVELDISAYAAGIQVGENTQIRGEYGAPWWRTARDSNHPGPRIFSRVRSEGLLWITKSATLRGFRLHGPDMEITEGKGRGIIVISGENVEIDNLELAGFCEAAVYAGDPRGRNNEFADVRVHNSYLHHNQGPDGDGYGVVVLDGAKALIEHNVFDFNRHAIASTSGAPGTGYHANENLVLKGGGHHVVNELVQWYTHSFDVHGSDSCGSDFNCGGAGSLYDITRNTFQYDSGNDFKLRGTPTQGAYLSENVFPQSESNSISETLFASGIHTANNTFSKDTFGNYGVCDFDGDGIDDLFLATGRTWWFSSAGKYQWTYLNSQPEELGQLGLGDFNHDGRCDVLRVRDNFWELSSGGKTPFLQLPPGFGGAYNQLRFADFNGDGFTDVFRRLPSGQWFGYFNFTSPAPVALQSSGLPLEELRFGDFDGDHITDVLGVSGGVWSWSRSGTEGWRTLNPRYDRLDGITMIADIDGLPGADVIWTADTATAREVWLSSGGTGEATKVGTLPLTINTAQNVMRPYDTYLLLGRFDHGPASLLKIDKSNRIPTKFQPFQQLQPHGLYAL